MESGILPNRVSYEFRFSTIPDPTLQIQPNLPAIFRRSSSSFLRYFPSIKTFCSLRFFSCFSFWRRNSSEYSSVMSTRREYSPGLESEILSKLSPSSLSLESMLALESRRSNRCFSILASVESLFEVLLFTTWMLRDFNSLLLFKAFVVFNTCCCAFNSFVFRLLLYLVLTKPVVGFFLSMLDCWDRSFFRL